MEEAGFIGPGYSVWCSPVLYVIHEHVGEGATGKSVRLKISVDCCYSVLYVNTKEREPGPRYLPEECRRLSTVKSQQWHASEPASRVALAVLPRQCGFVTFLAFACGLRSDRWSRVVLSYSKTD
eukprot:6205048-Pleurochrysis_carterae.AAC.1